MMDDMRLDIQVRENLIEVFDTEIDVSKIVAFRENGPNLDVIVQRQIYPIIIPGITRDEFRAAYFKAKANCQGTNQTVLD